MHLTDYNHLYRVSAAQQAWVLRGVRGIALQLEHAPTAEAVDRALPVVVEALDLERRYTVERKQRLGVEELGQLDRHCDDLVAALHGTLSAFSRLRRRTEVGRKAEILLAECFPAGLAAHVQETREVKVERTHALVDLLRAPAWSTLATDLGLGPVVDELEEANAALRRDVLPEAQVSWEELQAAVRAGEEAMLQVVFATLGAFDVRDAAAVAKREQILLPYAAMQERVRQAWKARNAKGKGEGDEPAPEREQPTDEPAAPEVVLDVAVPTGNAPIETAS